MKLLCTTIGHKDHAGRTAWPECRPTVVCARCDRVEPVDYALRCGWRVYGCKRVFTSEGQRTLHQLFGCGYAE